MTNTIPQDTDSGDPDMAGHETNYVRFCVRAATGRETWGLRALPLDDEQCARRGFNVIGPALFVAELSRERLDELLSLSRRKDPAGRAAFAERLGNLKRATVPGYDVDGDDGDTAMAIADAIRAEEARRGVELRVARSSGEGGAGLHLEFGPATVAARSVDLFHTMLRRCAAVAEAAGLVPKSDSKRGHAGVALTWTLPGREGATLDLIPMNHGPASRQRLFRPLGGLNKRNTARKSLVTGSPLRGSLITPELLAEAPAAPEPSAATWQRNKRRHEREWKLAPRLKNARLAPIVDVLRTLARHGDNHDVRLALCNVAQHKRLMSRVDWINALGAGLGDHVDAAAAWDSTAARREAGLACRGAGWLRERLGWRAVFELVKALALVTGVPTIELMRRFGSPTADKGQLERVAELTTDERLANRTGQAFRCLEYEHASACGGCDEELYRTRMRCGWLELCPACAFAQASKTDAWLRANWAEGDYVIGTMRGVERKKALDYMLRAQKRFREGQRALRIACPRADGLWDLAIVCPARSQAGRVARRHAATNKPTTRDGAVEFVIQALLERLITPLDLLERGEAQRAVDILEELYCTHRASGARNAALDWPSTEALRLATKERAIACSDHDCQCAADTPELHSYHHAPTEYEIMRASRYPSPMCAVVSAHAQAQACGHAPPDKPRRERMTPLRE